MTKRQFPQELKPEFLGVRDACRLLKRSAKTVIEWCQEGAIPGAFQLLNGVWVIPADAVEVMYAVRQEKSLRGQRGLEGKELLEIELEIKAYFKSCEARYRYNLGKGRLRGAKRERKSAP